MNAELIILGFAGTTTFLSVFIYYQVVKMYAIIKKLEERK